MCSYRHGVEPSASALVIVTMACLLLAYVVPHAIARRQRLLDARTDDRFSPDLRVVAVSHAAGIGELTLGGCPDSVGLEGPRRGYVLHAHAARVRKEMAVLRPYGVDDRAAARAAGRTQELRGQLADLHRRRRAGVRHRQILAACVLIASIVGIVAVAVWSVSVVVPIASALLLIGVLVAGQRATVGWQVQETRLRSAINQAEAETMRLQRAAARRRVRSSVAVADFPARRSEPDSMPGADGAQSSDWTPVPVPVPAYLLKPRAPRIAPTAAARQSQNAQADRPAREIDGTSPSASGVSAPSRPAVDTAMLKVTTPATAPVMVAEFPAGQHEVDVRSVATAGAETLPDSARRDETSQSPEPTPSEQAPSDRRPSGRRPLPVPESTGSFDLNLVLSRRRASGL